MADAPESKPKQIQRDDEDLIWVREIEEAFAPVFGPNGPKADTVYAEFNAGHLTKITFPGDRKTYFLRSEIRALWSTPRVERRAPSDDNQLRSQQSLHADLE